MHIWMHGIGGDVIGLPTVPCGEDEWMRVREGDWRELHQWTGAHTHCHSDQVVWFITAAFREKAIKQHSCRQLNVKSLYSSTFSPSPFPVLPSLVACPHLFFSLAYLTYFLILSFSILVSFNFTLPIYISPIYFPLPCLSNTLALFLLPSLLLFLCLLLFSFPPTTCLPIGTKSYLTFPIF